jgi:hypothetical protein
MSFLLMSEAPETKASYGEVAGEVVAPVSPQARLDLMSPQLGKSLGMEAAIRLSEMSVQDDSGFTF